MREKILAVIEKNSRIDIKDLSFRKWKRSILSADTIP